MVSFDKLGLMDSFVSQLALLEQVFAGLSKSVLLLISSRHGRIQGWGLGGREILCCFKECTVNYIVSIQLASVPSPRPPLCEFYGYTPNCIWCREPAAAASQEAPRNIEYLCVQPTDFKLLFLFVVFFCFLKGFNFKTLKRRQDKPYGKSPWLIGVALH